MVYTSIDNKKIKDIKKLNIKKYRDKSNEFLVEGEHVVLEAYKKGILKELILDSTSDFKLDVDTIYVSNAVLKHISELDCPPKIMGICNKFSTDSIGDKVLVLDGIQDPGNLGTIIRSAVAFNMDTVVLSENTVDLYNSKVLRATQGMIFNINIIRTNIKEFIGNIKNQNYIVHGTNVNNGKSIKNVEKSKKFAIIVGNEGSGVHSDILDLCDDYIYIDTNELCESLNVAVATSIILYELDK